MLFHCFRRHSLINKGHVLSSTIAVIQTEFSIVQKLWNRLVKFCQFFFSINAIPFIFLVSMLVKLCHSDQVSWQSNSLSGAISQSSHLALQTALLHMCYGYYQYLTPVQFILNMNKLLWYMSTYFPYTEHLPSNLLIYFESDAAQCWAKGDKLYLCLKPL